MLGRRDHGEPGAGRRGCPAACREAARPDRDRRNAQARARQRPGDPGEARLLDPSGLARIEEQLGQEAQALADARRDDDVVGLADDTAGLGEEGGDRPA
jgi:hypothetical protein